MRRKSKTFEFDPLREGFDQITPTTLPPAPGSVEQDTGQNASEETEPEPGNQPDKEKTFPGEEEPNPEPEAEPENPFTDPENEPNPETEQHTEPEPETQPAPPVNDTAPVNDIAPEPEPEPKKERRGRPRKEKETAPGTLFDESEYKQNDGSLFDAVPEVKPKKGSKQSAPNQATISGYLLLMLINIAVPMLFEMLTSAKAKDIKLEAHEVNELTPFADAAAAQLSVKINPVFLFVAMTGSIYFAKFQALQK